jgi:tetratricopeptide (TPR) repeat protein
MSAALAGADCVSDLAEARRWMAREDLGKALEAAERCGSVTGRILRGNLLYLTARDDEAVKVLEGVLREDPAQDEARYALGRVHYFNARYEPARELFAAMVERNPANYRAWDNLGLALEGAGQNEAAVKAHLRAIELVSKAHPDYDWAYGNLAELLMKMGENRRAFDLAVEAAGRGPGNARNFYLAGKALTRLEQWEKSLRWSRRAIELEPEYPEAHYLLGMALRRTGREEEARREFERTKELREKAPDKRR